jgi:hypothetical protein
MGDSQSFFAGWAVINVAFSKNGRQAPAANFIQGSVAVRADRGFVVSLFAGDHLDLLSIF